ncbi:hypothetical protein [Neobacillus terrae]|uniref:hypothetical protein n=1 Tax=Neobacillus terrae TaxID=3034837 RepID=UPI00140B7436|nr:hypothetical protein [Neobacillus terrae]NHM31289.1 hypothetical protein [Neobacillus terrae]
MPYLIYLCVLFIGIPVLLCIFILLTYKMTWIVLGLSVVLFFVWSVVHQTKKGYNGVIKGRVRFDGVDPDQKSAFYLYPDRITINDIQIIPMEQVIKASLGKYDNGFRYRGIWNKKEVYQVNLEFKDKEGKTQFLTCASKENPNFTADNYAAMVQAINKMVGYVEPQPTYPKKPYNL